MKPIFHWIFLLFNYLNQDHSFLPNFYGNIFYIFFFSFKVLVDGPETNVPRQAYRLNNLQLTKFALKFPYHAPTRVVRKAWRAADIKTKWENSSWAQKSKDIKKVILMKLFCVLDSMALLLYESDDPVKYNI